MSKKRSHRLVDMTRYLIAHPHKLISLNYFGDRYGVAKSSVSEDLGIIRDTFAERGVGKIETVPGASGGAFLVPAYDEIRATEVIEELVHLVDDETRLLPGGYVYMSDLLGNPDVLRKVGRLISTQYINQKIDVVMTIETKGIALAQAVAMYLNRPFVIVRNSSHITEGSTVSVNYVTASSQQIKKMELSRRSLQPGANVLIVDDFMKGGGSLNGMRSLVAEFGAKVVGMNVFAAGQFEGNRVVENCTALLNVDSSHDHFTVREGNYLDEVFYKQ